MQLSDNELARYSRQIILSEIGLKGQLKLKKSSVLIVGCGGLGSPAAYYLTAAGVGKIGLIDGDRVDRSNLSRQILHFTSDIAKPKSESAKEKLISLNPEIEVIVYNEKITEQNILGIIGNYDFIIDGSDTFQARYLINDACILKSKPFAHAGVLRFEGQVFTIIPHETPCFRCVFPVIPATLPTCQEAGILGSIAGILGLIQATEAIKFIINKGELLTGRLLIIDGLSMNFKSVKIVNNDQCPICGKNPSITKIESREDYKIKCA